MIDVNTRGPVGGAPYFPPRTLGDSPSAAAIGDWRSLDLGRLALLSPQIALALARGDQLVPYVASCKCTFSDPNVSNIPNVALEGGGTGGTTSFPAGIYQATVVDHVDYQINQQNAFSGQTLKSLADFFFNLQSGISATIDVYGAKPYSVAPFYQPLRTLTAFLKNSAFPHGWFLSGLQGLKMSFNADIPLPSLPVTVAFTFCMWTPSGTRYVRMEDATALQQLAQCGVCVPQC